MILILTPSFFSCESALVTQSCLNTLPQLINGGVRIKITIDATLKQNKTKQVYYRDYYISVVGLGAEEINYEFEIPMKCSSEIVM